MYRYLVLSVCLISFSSSFLIPHKRAPAYEDNKYSFLYRDSDLIPSNLLDYQKPNLEESYSDALVHKQLNNIERDLRRIAQNARRNYITMPLNLLLWIILIFLCEYYIYAQTEGDTAYDYHETYDDDFYDETALSQGPTFDAPVVNVTVVKDQTAVLPCSIEYLGKHKVAWLDFSSVILTYEDRRVIDDPRFDIERRDTKDWNLQIRDVRREDEGTYRCTINTNPIRTKLVNLHVNEPPQFDDVLSSHDVTVEEGLTLTLRCAVTGVPQPVITWYRREADLLSRCHLKQLETFDPGVVGRGENLTIRNITRHCDGVYECVGDNSVLTPVRKQILVIVEFPPSIYMPNKRLGQKLGRRETILNCVITAFPHANNYWEKEGRRLTSSLKYRIEAYEERDSSLTLSLRIAELGPADYGLYKCVAANELGRDEDVVQLFDIDKELQELEARFTTSRAQIEQIQQLHYQQLQYKQQNYHQQQQQHQLQHDTKTLYSKGSARATNNLSTEQQTHQQSQSSRSHSNLISDNNGGWSIAALFSSSHILQPFTSPLLISLVTSVLLTTF